MPVSWREMPYPAPAMPDFAPDAWATTRDLLRYEDLAQDGRLMPIALPPVLAGLWREVLSQHPGARNTMAQGILPILTRLVMATTNASIRADRSLESRIGFELARDDGDGDPQRLFLNAWAAVQGRAGRRGPGLPEEPPNGQPDAPLVLAGELFAEHVFTRPFATADQRRVTRLDVEGFPAVPPRRYAPLEPSRTGEVPAGGRARGELTTAPVPFTFSLDHTDGNQHVNSLVYIRVALEASVRRLAALGMPLVVGSRAVEIAYRKPCFAGDTVHVQLRAFEHADGIGTAGVIVGATDGKPRCYVRTLLTP